MNSLKAFNEQIQAGIKPVQAYKNTLMDCSKTVKQHAVAIAKGSESYESVSASMNAMSVSAKAASLGMKALSVAANMALTIGLSMLAEAAVQGIQHLIHANEEAIEAAEELRSKYDEFKESNSSNTQTLNDLKDEFEELSEGVSRYGDNISLTSEQYERYKEIIEQIVGISPSLADGYSRENGYIVEKNGLLERAIELQETEYQNELRKRTNLAELETSMKGYIAAYKEAFDSGFVTADGDISGGTQTSMKLSNALYELFNTNNRSDFSSEDMAKQIMGFVGVKDIDKEIEKYYNDYGYFQTTEFYRDYADTIADNISIIIDSLSSDEVGLDDTIFDQVAEKLDSAATSYNDMKDAVSAANEDIQTDLAYIAEASSGYGDLTSEQLKFVSDYLKNFNISDIMTENFWGIYEYDEDKMASVKSQIEEFVETLSQDEESKQILVDLYAEPTEDESVNEYVDRVKNAIIALQTYCNKHDIVIPISLEDTENDVDDLDSKYQAAITSAKNKFGDSVEKDFDWDALFKENSINTEDEITQWNAAAKGVQTP